MTLNPYPDQQEYERGITIDSSEPDAVEKVLAAVRLEVQQVQQVNQGKLAQYTFACSWRLRRK